MNPGNHIFQAVTEALAKEDLSARNGMLFLLFNRYVDEWMEGETVSCHTLFSKITFLSMKHHWPARLKDWCHAYRIISKRNIHTQKHREQEEEETILALASICSLLQFRYKCEIPGHLYKHFKHIKDIPRSFSKTPASSLKRFVIMDIREEGDAWRYVGMEEDAVGELTILSDALLPSTDKEILREMTGMRDTLPLVVNLLDVEYRNDDWCPAGIVIQPDYLIDVTAVSECFEPHNVNVWKYLLRKLTPTTQSHYLLTGNVANDFLDALIRQPDREFIPLLKTVFKRYPLHWIRYDDEQTKKIIHVLKLHYDTLKKTVTTLLPAVNIRREAAILEPSFYSVHYGIQGRLDLFDRNEQQRSASIVELKSGSVFMPNKYELNANHYVQTLLYDRLIYSVYPGIKRMSYILYSKYLTKPLRYAPVVRDIQKLAISIRNRIMYFDYLIGYLDEDEKILELLIQQAKENAKGFFGRDVQSFAEVFKGASPLDKAYFRCFVAMMAREQQVARLGRPGIKSRRGAASLWLNSVREKVNQFEMIRDLVYESGDFDDERPVITMRRPQDEKDSDLANFRTGDITVLYPYNAEELSALQNQLFKGTIISIDAHHVRLRLRNAQLLEDYLREEPSWNLEHDNLDMSFNQITRGMFHFLRVPRDKKDLIYGLKAPESPGNSPEINWNTSDENLHPSQIKILNAMVNSRDYYLLWGPPGTGKTSYILKYFVRYLMDESRERILLLAYTNRAVDEICKAINALGAHYKKQYIRLGSRFATGEDYRENLIHQSLENINTRKELLDFLRKKRIFISTLASLHSNDLIFDSFRFDTVIVDEAGQILEAALAPVLTRFKRFILIGDHKQLPAVITQPECHFKTKSAALKEIGLNTIELSLFERLFLHAKNNNWRHAYGMLEYQGRMHKDIVHFVSKTFYENHLKPLPSLVALRENQIYNSESQETCPNPVLARERCLFIPTRKDSASITGKTNTYEAGNILTILEDIKHLMASPPNDYSIGIITPYRAQIAQIKSLLGDFENTMNISIDTVERYQGSERDLIILSLCTNYKSQLKVIGAPPDHPINRKFNVAITRAKKQVIVLGNPEILTLDPALKAWMDHAYTWEIEEGTCE